MTIFTILFTAALVNNFVEPVYGYLSIPWCK